MQPTKVFLKILPTSILRKWQRKYWRPNPKPLLFHLIIIPASWYEWAVDKYDKEKGVNQIFWLTEISFEIAEPRRGRDIRLLPQRARIACSTSPSFLLNSPSFLLTSPSFLLTSPSFLLTWFTLRLIVIPTTQDTVPCSPLYTVPSWKTGSVKRAPVRLHSVLSKLHPQVYSQ